MSELCARWQQESHRELCAAGLARSSVRQAHCWRTCSGSLARMTRSAYSLMSELSDTSSSASLSVLPISMVISSAKPFTLPMFVTAALTASVRCSRLMAAHAGCALRAAAIAASTCAVVETGTRSMTSPVAGFTSTSAPFSSTTPCTMTIVFSDATCHQATSPSQCSPRL